MISKFFDKKFSGSGVNNQIKQNEQLTEKLYKPIIKKIKRRSVYSSFKDNVWGVDLGDIQVISKFNKEIRFSLCVIDVYLKNAWVIPLKDKKCVTIVNDFQRILDDSKRNPNKIWADKGSELYNRLMKSWLQNNNRSNRNNNRNVFNT